MFRGSWANADYSNIMMVHRSWFVDKYQNKVIENWEAATGESVDQDPKNVSFTIIIIQERVLIKILRTWKW